MNTGNIFCSRLAAILAAVLFFAGFNLSLAQAPSSLPPAALEHMSANVCPPTPGPGAEARCHARVVTDKGGGAQTSSLPTGLGPAQFQGAYNLTGLTSGKTIAIVDAYNNPNAKADLDKYDQTFGLPAFPNCSATVSASCFKKVDQRGGTNYPVFSSGWGLEISLDVEVAHAACPTCKLILVEADSSSFNSLLAAEDRAVALGANVISNSWGANEFSGETAYDAHFNRPGIAITFSSGDSGFKVEYPAASPYVTAVGGTTLNLSGNAYVSETAWSGAGSGCSTQEAQPSFQTALGLSGCANRFVADVSADANPNTGAAVYDSCYQQSRRGCSGGWFQVGGTSLASPLVAAVYAQAGDVGPSDLANTFPYTKGSYLNNLHDITSGSNGSCGGSYLCTAGAGYDGPTGMGSPKGTGAF